MENGALPRGPSYRVHPRLYLLVVSVRCQSSEAIGGEADTLQESLKLARMARTHPQTSGVSSDQHNGRHLTNQARRSWRHKKGQLPAFLPADPCCNCLIVFDKPAPFFVKLRDY